MKRLAVIDCGTNTFNLLIIELLNTRKYTKVFQTRLAVKLGERSINEGYIAEPPFQRGIEAIGVFKDICNEYEVNSILAFATSAIRDASNGAKFVEDVSKQFAIGIQVINGSKEAELIYRGVKEAVCFTDAPSLVMDIGGGSNEFVIANKDTIFWKSSFNIGAARILEKFKLSDPALPSEIEGLRAYLSEQLKTLSEAVKEYKPTELVGSSGVFESFIELINSELKGEPLVATKTEYDLNLKNYTELSERLKRSTLMERRAMKGLVPMRVDMIVISCVMVDLVLNTFPIDKIRVSTFSLKEGALEEYICNLKS